MNEPTINPICDQRPPKGSWAPGFYMLLCSGCRQSFVGDKRAARCADCAYGGEGASMNEPTKKTDHMDALRASDAPMGSVNELRKFLDETDPSVDLLKRAEDAVFWLRNGGEDDPYLTTTPELMGFQREQARANGDDLPGDITICVADGCLVCTVATNEGEPMFGMAEAIAGAGKLINELSIEVTSLRARVAELEKELEHTRECRLEDERAWRGIREERDAACPKGDKS